MHIEKYTTSAVNGLAFHCERLGDNHTNKNIDVSRSCDNINLSEYVERFEIDCSEMFPPATDSRSFDINKNNLKNLIDKHEKITGRALRKDAPTVCSIVVTLPEQYKDFDRDSQDAFFFNAIDFLTDKFGKRIDNDKSNVLYATVHYDETTPHLHYAFVPVTDKNTISYKEVVNRGVYRSLHQEMDNYLQEHWEYYKGGILLSPEKQRTRAYNIKDAQKLNEKFNEREFLCTMKEEDLKEKEKDLNARENNLNTKEKDLNARENNLNTKEKDLNTRENELNSKIKGWEDDRPRRDGIREEVMKKKEELEELEELKKTEIKKLEDNDKLCIYRYIKNMPSQIKDQLNDDLKNKTPNSEKFFSFYKAGKKIEKTIQEEQKKQTEQLLKDMQRQKQQEHSITR